MNYNGNAQLGSNNFLWVAQLIENPLLDESQPKVEQLVSCQCGADYRVLVNGKSPIADTKMQNIHCPNCHTDACNYLILSGHSSGRLNASIVVRKR